MKKKERKNLRNKKYKYPSILKMTLKDLKSFILNYMPHAFDERNIRQIISSESYNKYKDCTFKYDHEKFGYITVIEDLEGKKRINHNYMLSIFLILNYDEKKKVNIKDLGQGNYKGGESYKRYAMNKSIKQHNERRQKNNNTKVSN